MNKIKVVVYKYNGTKHYQWETNLIEKKKELLL
jgi:protein associated with RNAse G/E